MKVCMIVISCMLCVCIGFHVFGVPWSANFFDDFNKARDEMVVLVEPVMVVGNTLRQSYDTINDAVDGFKKFKHDITFWQGDISYWAVVKCGLKSPYQMSPDECLGVFKEFDEFLRTELPDPDVRAAFVQECRKYVYFGLDKSGNLIPLYTGTPATFSWLWCKAPNYLDLLFTYIGNYGVADTLKCYANGAFVNPLGTVGTSGGRCFGSIPVMYEGEQHHTYLWFYGKTYEYCQELYQSEDNSLVNALPLRELIPFSYEEFAKRVGSEMPNHNIMPYQQDFKNCPW